MRAYFDTSVLVPAFMERHSRHESARRWLERAGRGEVAGILAAHAVAETWAVLSVLSGPSRPGMAGLRAITESLLSGPFTVMEPDRETYRRAIEGLQARGLRGGIVYDALHVETARAACADVILTYDLADFRRVAPDLADRIREP